MGSKIQEWAAAQDADLDEIKSTLQAIGQGVEDLDKKITEFQNSPDSITPADQKLLDAMQAKSKALVQMAQAIKVNATDGQPPASTPPEEPTQPTEEPTPTGPVGPTGQPVASGTRRG